MTDAAWQALGAAGTRLRDRHLRDLLADPDRFARFSVAAEGLLIDFSKEKLDEDALGALLDLARATGVEAARDAMFAGAPVNATEGRAALHVALRGGTDEAPAAVRDAARGRAQMLAFAEEVRAGGRFDDVLAIGIGGSHLGPELAVRALAPFHDGPRIRFVANVDGTELADAVRGCDPARTLAVIVSKTFTTRETMLNAASARDWLGPHAGAAMAAVSTNLAATEAFGIPSHRVFGFADWVGGRFSLWSPVGLPVALAVGAARFEEMLAGAAAIDRHFRTAPLAGNLPVLLALIAVWRRNVMGWPVRAVIPYEARLALLPDHLQQLEMESLGKPGAQHPTGAAVYGVVGTNAQHSFFQHFHQSPDVTPVDFLLGAEPVAGTPGHHDVLAANALAQGAALALGRVGEGPRDFPGDRPSTTILYRRLDPATLGRLLALFEHKVAAQATLLGINAFDQFGVELGKTLAAGLEPKLASGDVDGLDPSTAGLLAALRKMRGG